MFELPRGLWRWFSDNARDLARIAGAMEQIAEEISGIRAAMEDDDREDERQ